MRNLGRGGRKKTERRRRRKKKDASTEEKKAKNSEQNSSGERLAIAESISNTGGTPRGGALSVIRSYRQR